MPRPERKIIIAVDEARSSSSYGIPRRSFRVGFTRFSLDAELREVLK